MIPLTPNIAVVLCVTVRCTLYIPLSLCMSWFHLLDFLPSQIQSTGSGGLHVGREGNGVREGERESWERGEETYSRQNELKHAQLYSLLIVASGLPVPLQG